MVDGKQFRINSATQRGSGLRVGSRVTVVGHTGRDGILYADVISVQARSSIAFSGVINLVAGKTIMVGERQINIAKARVIGVPRVGAFAQGVGEQRADGSIQASLVIVSQPGQTPEAPTPQATPGPEQTATATVELPAQTPTPPTQGTPAEPTNTPAPDSETRVPTPETPEPSADTHGLRSTRRRRLRILHPLRR